MACDCGGYCDFHEVSVDRSTTCPNTDCRLECDCATITCAGAMLATIMVKALDADS